VTAWSFMGGAICY